MIVCSEPDEHGGCSPQKLFFHLGVVPRQLRQIPDRPGSGLTSLYSNGVPSEGIRIHVGRRSVPPWPALSSLRASSALPPIPAIPCALERAEAGVSIKTPGPVSGQLTMRSSSTFSHRQTPAQIADGKLRPFLARWNSATEKLSPKHYEKFISCQLDEQQQLCSHRRRGICQSNGCSDRCRLGLQRDRLICGLAK